MPKSRPAIRDLLLKKFHHVLDPEKPLMMQNRPKNQALVRTLDERMEPKVRSKNRSKTG
ncbi:MAG: hypothetical protein K8F25_04425 [Fimbriimonadaceae bacterium]|nr:hypothetical protein [Alphaproteobacteria bacterium]